MSTDELRGSFDPVWTAGAEGRFLAGAFTTRPRHTILLVGRTILLLALVAPALGPFLGAFNTAQDAFRAPIAIGLAAVVVLGVRRGLMRH